MCLAQGPQHSDAGVARVHGPSVKSQALYYLATALPALLTGGLKPYYSKGFNVMTLISDLLPNLIGNPQYTVPMET